MPDRTNPASFPKLNHRYNTVFRPVAFTIRLVVPIEAHHSSTTPDMSRHVERAQLADELGFAALWLRDVPLNVPSFGDAGQMFDPFVYLRLLSATTNDISLGVASIILPLRHPAHVAKADASADQLSGGRLLLGVASGDRPKEYPALGMTFPDRGERFRHSLAYICAMGTDHPHHTGALSGSMDMLLKPVADRVPILITGGSQQSPDWIAAHGAAGKPIHAMPMRRNSRSAITARNLSLSASAQNPSCNRFMSTLSRKLKPNRFQSI